MANCNYTIVQTKEKFNSLTELLNFLDTKDLNDFASFSDIVCSKFAKRDSIRKKLIELNREYVPKKRVDSVNSAISTIIDGEPSIRESNAIPISEWIDHPSCKIDDKPLITQLVKQDYIDAEIEHKVNNGMDRDEAEKEVKNILKNWETIEEDAIVLHSLFTSPHINNPSDFEAEAKLTPRLDLVTIGSLNTQLQKFIKESHYVYPEGKTLTNINLRSEIENFNKDLIGHIDYLFIDRRGTLHIYNFVTSHTHPKEWTAVKSEKYKYKLAFLKQMLANKGINVKNMSLNLVPVELKYNKDFSKIESIAIRDTIRHNLTKYGNPALNKHFNKVKYFIKSNLQEIESLPQGIKQANELINAIFPTLNIKSEGIATSARDWIRNAPQSGDASTPIIIRKSDNPDYAYDLIIYGKVEHIKSNKRITKNVEIEQKVIEHLAELEDNRGDVTQALKTILDKATKTGVLDFLSSKYFKEATAARLDVIFEPYIRKPKEGESEWQFIDQLIDQNIFIFKNKKSGQTDIISLSSLNLNATANISGNTNILGGYKRDGATKTLSSQYGNIEAIRTLAVLNSTFPELEDSSMKLGQIKIISPAYNAQLRSYDISNLTKNYLPEIFQTVKKYNPEIDVKNNLSQAEFVDYVDLLYNQYLEAVEGKSENLKDSYNKMGFEQLSEVHTKAAQLLLIQDILNQLSETFPSMNALKNAQASRNENLRLKAQLYILTSNAYQYLTGEHASYGDELSWTDTEVYTPTTVPDKNINIVVSNFITTADIIAEQTLKQWEIYRPAFMNFYRQIGYTKTENAVIGDLTSKFSNLYDKENMMFKNPYDLSNNLTSAERELLKKVLKYLYDIRRTFNPGLKEITDVEKYIQSNPNYLQVPLIRASGASKLQQGGLKNAARNILKVIRDPKTYWDEFVENLIPEEVKDLDSGVEKLSLMNNFEKQQDQEFRKKLLENHGADYFETNLEDILLAVLNKYIQVNKMNTFLVGSKNIIFQLEMLGDMAGTEKIIDQEIKYIKDYIKVNVFQRSIMGKTGQTVVGILTPLRKAVTTANLAGNVVSYFRDNIQGFTENTIRTIIKFQTDLSYKDVAEAYAYVVPNSVNNAMNVSKLSALCAKYRISNSDLNRITERLRTGRGGVLNADNWAYATLRSPDFMNRMVLFVARCMHDGCWDAISVKDDVLVYNWKKDKRFEIYAKGDKNHPDYSKQRSLYLSKIQEYNEEHPENQLEYDEHNEIHLPEPYSRAEILSIRNVDRNIYGAYDKSMKSMGEHTAKWWAFGMYTTWMNGMFNNYFMKPGEYQISQRKLEQQRNDQGELLFFDENGGLTTKDTGIPYIKGTPMIVQGIYYTLKDIVKTFDKEGFKAACKYVGTNEVAKRNMLKLFSDAIISILGMVLVKLAFGAYKDYKKEMDENPVIQNLIVEVLYKSSTRAWDSFQGPLNIINFVGENMNPPIYQLPMKLFSDSMSFLVGDKNFGQILTGNLAIARSYKDTYNAWLKSQE